MALFDEVSQIVAGQTAATNISATFAGDLISGNTLVLVSVDRSGQQNPTPIGAEGVTGDPSTGWQKILDANTLPDDTSFRRHLVVWIAHVDGLDDPTAKVRGCTYDANTNGVILCVQYEGELELDQIASADSGTTAVNSQTTGTTPTTTTAAELILAAVLVRHGNAGTVGWTNSLATVAEHNNGNGTSRIRAVLADLVVAATDAYESSASWTTTTTATAGIVTLKEAGGTGAQTVAVGAASETETAQAVSPVAGAVSVTVTAATETETAQAIAVVTIVSVTVGAAVESEAVETVAPVPGVVSVAVGAATETEAAQVVAVVQGGGAQTIDVDTVTETENAETVIPVAVVSVSVGAAIETESAETVIPVTGGSPQSVTVTAATETESVQAVTVLAGSVSITVTAATESETAGTVTPIQGGSPQSILVTAATETESAEAVTAANIQAVGVAVEGESAVAVGIVTGATSISVGVAIETETAQVVAPIAGAEYDMVIAYGAPTDNWRTGGLKGQWSTGTLSKRGHTHGPIKT